MKQIISILLVIVPFSLCAQISERLYKQLPDSVRPANINAISFAEGKKILAYAWSPNNFSPEDFKELDKKCSAIMSITKTSGSKKEDIFRNNHLIAYWYSRSKLSLNPPAHAVDSMVKYNQNSLVIIKKDIKKLEIQLAHYHLINGTILKQKEKYTDAYNELNNVLDIYRNHKRYGGARDLFNALTDIYYSLELFSDAAATADSAFFYAKKANILKENQPIPDEMSFIIYNKASILLSRWLYESRTKQDEISILRLCSSLIRNNTNRNEIRAMAYAMISKLMYHKKEFEKSIIYIDSVLLIVPDTAHTAARAEGEIYRGLALVRLGKKEEGIRLIRKNQAQAASDPLLLQELFLFEKNTGNLRKALEYHESILTLKMASQVNKHRGQIFEIQQKYNLSEKDLSIQKLNEEKRINKLFAGVAGLIVCFAGLVVGIRYRNNQKRTQTLVAQMEELTELQILRIEEEKGNERKRLGQSLHDDLAGTIAASIRYLRMKAEEDPKDKIWLSDISDILENSYDIARGKSHELYLEKTSASFWKRLNDNIDLFFMGTDMKVTLTCEAFDTLLTPEIKTTMLLFIKESITNIIKHAKASEVEILVYEDLGKVILEVGDNGKGISSKSISANVGLKSLKERAIKLNGEFIISAGKTAGTNLKLIIPIEQTAFPEIQDLIF